MEMKLERKLERSSAEGQDRQAGIEQRYISARDKYAESFRDGVYIIVEDHSNAFELTSGDCHSSLGKYSCDDKWLRATHSHPRR